MENNRLLSATKILELLKLSPKELGTREGNEQAMIVEYCKWVSKAQDTKTSKWWIEKIESNDLCKWAEDGKCKYMIQTV